MLDAALPGRASDLTESLDAAVGVSVFELLGVALVVSAFFGAALFL